LELLADLIENLSIYLLQLLLGAVPQAGKIQGKAGDRPVMQMADGGCYHRALPHSTDHFCKTGEDEEMIDRHKEL
jgi:hypothetical protein